MQPPHDSLDPLLERWREVTPAPPGSLASEVWRRIAAAENIERPGVLARIEAAFARPSFAFTFVTACVLLGLFVAEVRISRLQAERSTQLARSYLHLIDPLLDGVASSEVAPTPHS